MLLGEKLKKARKNSVNIYLHMAIMSEGKMLVRPFRYSLMGSIVHSKMRK